jgi:hypothetical protein
MGSTGFFFYVLSLSLWTGGIVMYTFVVTPAIFRALHRDLAARVVGVLFPGYYFFNLAVSLAALAIFLLAWAFGDSLGLGSPGWGLSLALLGAGVTLNLFIVLKLYPDIKAVKKEISTFETVPADSPSRRTFGRLHAVSAALNVLLLADGFALLALGVFVRNP